MNGSANNIAGSRRWRLATAHRRAQRAMLRRLSPILPSSLPRGPSSGLSCGLSATALWLAQATPWTSRNTQQLVDILTYLGIIVAVSLVVGLIGWRLYKRYKAADTAEADRGFTLAEIRILHREGHMTDEEYEEARAMIIGATLGAVAGPREGDHDDPLAPRPGELGYMTLDPDDDDAAPGDGEAEDAEDADEAEEPDHSGGDRDGPDAPDDSDADDWDSEAPRDR